jgi:hypothetical protein
MPAVFWTANSEQDPVGHGGLGLRQRLVRTFSELVGFQDVPAFKRPSDQAPPLSLDRPSSLGEIPGEKSQVVNIGANTPASGGGRVWSEHGQPPLHAPLVGRPIKRSDEEVGDLQLL